MLYYHDHYPLNLMVESSLAMISHKKKIDEWINMVMGLSNFTTINMDYTILPTIRMAGYGKKNNLWIQWASQALAVSVMSLL